MIKWILGVSAAVSLAIATLLTITECIGFNMRYHEYEYKKHRVDLSLKMEMDDILEVRKQILLYLKNERDDLTIYTIVDGEEREFLNDLEKQHMEDVLALFEKSYLIRSATVWILFFSVLLELLFFRKKGCYTLLSSIKITFTAIICISILLLICLAIDFTACFTLFHEVLFNNDLWMLNPDKDLLVNLVPEPFWSDTAVLILITFFGVLLLAIIISTFILRRRKRKIFIIR